MVEPQPAQTRPLSRRTIYVSIGNSDDKLPQAVWAEFVKAVDAALGDHGVRLHGRWFSAPDVPWQSACWCFEIRGDRAAALQLRLIWVAAEYQQDSIAWAEVPDPQFLKPNTSAKGTDPS